MRVSLYRWIALACLAFASLVAAPVNALEPVRIGILAVRPKLQAVEQWRHLAVALKQAIPDRDFEISLLTFAELEAAAGSRQIDFLLANPGHYV